MYQEIRAVIDNAPSRSGTSAIITKKVPNHD